MSRKAAEAELDFLIRAIENVHPNPYAVRSRESFNADRDRLRASIPDSIDPADWCLQLAALVASLEDGHTVVDCNVLLVMQLLVKQGAPRDFPMRLRVDSEQRLIVTDVLASTGEIARGDRLVRVNEREAEELLAGMVREISGDTLAARRSRAAASFALRLGNRLDEPPDSVTVVTADGAERLVELPPPAPVPSAETPKKSEAGAQAFSYRTMAPGIGYLDFYSMAPDPYRFEKEAKTLFKEMARESIGTLIVDLRRNGGGRQVLGEAFLSYLTEKPFRIYSHSEIKRSKELREWEKAHVHIPFRWLPLQFLFKQGRALYRGPVGSSAVLNEQAVTAHKNKPSFRGNVCFLTGPGTFSAAVLLADAVKTYGLGTIIGAPTGGRPNTGGYVANRALEPFHFQLPQSGASLYVPSLLFIRANGNRTDLAPVLPDIPVDVTAADIRAGRDPVLERALTCGH
jgi:C-terminal processing protease CtpA/Prc